MPRSAKAGKNKLLAEMWEKRRKTEKNRISCCKTHGGQVIILWEFYVNKITARPARAKRRSLKGYSHHA